MIDIDMDTPEGRRSLISSPSLDSAIEVILSNFSKNVSTHLSNLQKKNQRKDYCRYLYDFC